ncbi:MAG: ABC transporter ATP-binding protein, partial [Chloroflexi bacterium]|nr:ABC transporter ATP-binding protein [Chloroflexota bacterium]
MTALTQSAEFTLPQRFRSNRRGPARWLASHALRHWPLGVIMFFGALSNALLAALIPVLIGRAFDGILARPPNTTALLRSALFIIGAQLLRSLLQFGRNFGA